MPPCRKKFIWNSTCIYCQSIRPLLPTTYYPLTAPINASVYMFPYTLITLLPSTAHQYYTQPNHSHHIINPYSLWIHTSKNLLPSTMHHTLHCLTYSVTASFCILYHLIITYTYSTINQYHPKAQLHTSFNTKYQLFHTLGQKSLTLCISRHVQTIS